MIRLPENEHIYFYQHGACSW